MVPIPAIDRLMTYFSSNLSSAPPSVPLPNHDKISKTQFVQVEFEMRAKYGKNFGDGTMVSCCSRAADQSSARSSLPGRVKLFFNHDNNN